MKKKNTQVKPYLLTRSLLPENQETPIHFLFDEVTTASYFFRRNHFPYPNLSAESFYLPVEGSVQVPKIFTYQELLSLPAKTVKVMLECSGDKRASFQPKTFGEQWGEGALSQAYWKGVSLKTLFQYTGVQSSAREVVVEGYDTGTRTDMKGTFRFARGLPIEKALHPDTIIAYELNGQPIPFKHGYPLRLIVPQWYAMASVKWIKKITVIDGAFQGPFQAIDYVYYPEKNSDTGKHPVTTMNINSTIQQPLNLSCLSQGVHFIQGIAWTGEGMVTRVDVSVDNGQTWLPASLQQNPVDLYSWLHWTFRWNVEKKGEYTLISRAIDSLGRVQPVEAAWNRKGYGYNAVCKVRVKVE
jgi:DMSO/TMAO reductase YedYZ molybdopterin-dependent catalytic subunit